MLNLCCAWLRNGKKSLAGLITNKERALLIFQILKIRGWGLRECILWLKIKNEATLQYLTIALLSVCPFI